jgi:hypothetical protein
MGRAGRCDLSDLLPFRSLLKSLTNALHPPHARRVAPGVVYRLYSMYFWETDMPEYSPPEMQRCPIDNLILQVHLLS